MARTAKPQPEQSVDTENVETQELSFQDKLEELSKEIDPSLVKQRYGYKDRNTNEVHYFDYIKWETAADILDRICPNWSYEIKNFQIIDGYAICAVAITIDGVTREGIGTGELKGDSFEMGIKGAESDALKRAATKFGIARYLYAGDTSENASGPEPYRQSAPQGQAPSYTGGNGGGEGKPFPTEFPADCRASSALTLASPKQIGMIKALCREQGMDAELTSVQITQVALDQLNKQAASALINYIQTGQALQAVQTDEVAARAYVPPVTEQLPPGVTRGMPTNATVAPAPQPMPPPQAPVPAAPPTMKPPQAATPAQGRLADIGRKKGVAFYATKCGWGLDDVVMNFTNGRTNNIDQMSEAEAQAAIESMSAAV